MIMKVKYLWIVFFVSLTFFSCDDNTGTLGLDMFPGSDQNINGKLATFEVTTKSELAENTFAKTSIGYLGKFTDQDFGYYEAGFLTQFHCNEGFHFPVVCDPKNEADRNNPKAIMVKDGIYRTELILGYSTYFGDSLTASRLSVYRLNKSLDKETAYYTDIDPGEFYSKNDPAALLGRKAYTAVDLSVSDSIRKSSGYYPSVTVTLPNSLGEEILKASRQADKENVDFANKFSELLKGVYVKNDYGDGTILYINRIQLNVVYEIFVRDTLGVIIPKKYDSKVDSTAYGYRSFTATKEIIQANSFKNDESKLQEMLNDKTCTYLKTPAGIYTQATLPLINKDPKGKKGVLDSLGNDTLNTVKLSFTNYNQSNNNSKYNMTAPTYLLLLREKDRDKFFEENKINDDVTSYIAVHNKVNTNQYVFPNITRLINTCKAEREAAVLALQTDGRIDDILGVDGKPVTTIEAWEEVTKWDKIAVIPVTITTTTSNQTEVIISVLNDLQPGYAKLKGGEQGGKLALDIIYTSF